MTPDGLTTPRSALALKKTTKRVVAATAAGYAAAELLGGIAAFTTIAFGYPRRDARLPAKHLALDEKAVVRGPTA
jgi:hypothetical protein